MQRSCLNWNRAASALFTMVLLATGAGMSRADSPDAKADAPKPLPEKIVKAWKEAGAKVGWMSLSPHGFPRFVPEEGGQPGDLPAFIAC